MIRCPACGHTAPWSPVLIRPCTHCGAFMMCPAYDIGKAHGIFEVDYVPPYTWEVEQPEASLLFDGLDNLMDSFQEALAMPGNIDEEVERLSGSYVYAKLTRQKFWSRVPDLQEEVLKR